MKCVKEKDYALYHGDDFVTVGTINQICEETGKTKGTLKYYAMPSYWRKCASDNHYVLIRIED